MTDPVIIERSELERMARLAALLVVREFEKNKGKNEPWISQNQATKILGKGGRGKLDRAMAKDLVKFHKRNPDTKLGRVMVCYEDLEKLLNNPKI
jgi:hypothetical protein